ncbi:MAG: calcium-binding protein [Acetobacter sp.]
MSIITVVGASGGTVQVTVDGAQNAALVTQGTTLSNTLAGVITTLDTRKLGLSATLSSRTNQAAYGVITAGGAYNIVGNVSWLTVGSDSAATPGVPLNDAVTINAAGSTANTTILGGTNAGITLQAGDQNGTFFAGTGNNQFTGQAGDWSVTTGNGNDTITSGDGNNTIAAGLGSNLVDLGLGVNFVYSTGQDTITASGGVQTVSLEGAGSTVVLGDNSLVIDSASGQKITVGGASTVAGGVSDSVTFTGQDGTVEGGLGSTISATSGNLQTSNTDAANITVLQDLTFIGGTGQTHVTAGHATIFGSNGLDMTFDMTRDVTADIDNVFAANGGNMTLDGASSAFGIHAFGNNEGTTGAQTFVGGAGADTLVAGVGDATLTGGTGDANIFGFRDHVAGGDYTITDFGAVAGNSVLLVNYDYTHASFQTDVLDHAVHSGANTTITLADNSKITFVNVASLNGQSFTGF